MPIRIFIFLRQDSLKTKKRPSSIFSRAFVKSSCVVFISAQRVFFSNLAIVKLGGFIAFPALCRSKGCDGGCGARSWY